SRRGAEAGGGCAEETGEDQKYCVCGCEHFRRARSVNGWHVVRQAKQADDILASATKIIVKLEPHMDIDTKKEAFAVYQRGADHGDVGSMGNLGVLYREGFGVTQDYAKAREWYEKAAHEGDERAMTNLGVLYAHGWGVAQNYVKAREWYEKA